MTGGMDGQKSRFERVVVLRRWWLVKAEKSVDGKQLAVAGYSNREKEPRRVFTSAPILKRCDRFNIETTDGIDVNLRGLIDKARTEDNGFPSEIFQHFGFGFPVWWEECAKKYLSKEYTDVNLCETEVEKKSADVHESTPVHAKVPVVSPEVDTKIKAASPQVDEDVVPGCLVSSNAEKDQYLTVETFQRNNSFASDAENQDAKQGEAMTKPNQQIRMKKSVRASRNSRSVKNDLTAVKSEISVTVDVNLSRREAEKESAHMNESTPVHNTVPIVSPETATTSGIEAASPQAVEHETAYEDIVPECLVSSNVDEDQYLSVETVRRNHSSASFVQKQQDKQGEATAKLKQQNDLTSGKSKTISTANVKLSGREAEKKSPHVNEGTPVHDTAPTVSPKTDITSGIEAASPHAGGLDSSNGDKDQYLSAETVQRDHSSAIVVEKLDAKQIEATPKPNRHARSSSNLRSVKNDLTSSVKSKRSFTANVDLSRREPEKKSLHMNESTPVHDSVPILSPEAASFRRSRSGRLLLPRLKYWCNERAVFNKDGKIVGVKCILDNEHLDKGSQSEPPKKRRNLQ